MLDCEGFGDFLAEARKLAAIDCAGDRFARPAQLGGKGADGLAAADERELCRLPESFRLLRLELVFTVVHKCEPTIVCICEPRQQQK